MKTTTGQNTNNKWASRRFQRMAVDMSTSAPCRSTPTESTRAAKHEQLGPLQLVPRARALQKRMPRGRLRFSRLGRSLDRHSLGRSAFSSRRSGLLGGFRLGNSLGLCRNARRLFRRFALRLCQAWPRRPPHGDFRAELVGVPLLDQHALFDSPGQRDFHLHGCLAAATGVRFEKLQHVLAAGSSAFLKFGNGVVNILAFDGPVRTWRFLAHFLRCGLITTACLDHFENWIPIISSHLRPTRDSPRNYWFVFVTSSVISMSSLLRALVLMVNSFRSPIYSRFEDFSATS